MRLVLACCFLVFSTFFASAEPVSYRLDPANSKLSFSYKFGARTITGSFPDFKTDLIIDFQNVQNSSTSVTANANKIRGGFPFATGILRGPDMLHTRKFPTVIFKSIRVTGGGNTATIHGEITVRGVTKPQKLTAKLFRPSDRSAGDNSDLRMKLTGSLNRHDFGVSAFPEEVGAILNIAVDARILAK